MGKIASERTGEIKTVAENQIPALYRLRTHKLRTSLQGRNGAGILTLSVVLIHIGFEADKQLSQIPTKRQGSQSRPVAMILVQGLDTLP